MNRPHAARKTLTLDDFVRGIEQADRTTLARAITLIESSRPEDRARSNQLLDRLLPMTGNAMRIGISGVPGVGKSLSLIHI